MNTPPAPTTDFFVESLELSAKQRQVLDAISAHPNGITAAALAKQLGSHVNTIRGHLEELVAKGAIIALTQPSAGRGRPTLLYQAQTPDNRAIATEYIALINILARQCAALAPNTADTTARQVGQQWAEHLQVDRNADPQALTTHLQALFRRLGFAPQEGEGTITLGACPLRSVQEQPTRFLCQVHQGMLDTLFPRNSYQLQLRSFHDHDNCSIAITPVAGDQATQ